MKKYNFIETTTNRNSNGEKTRISFWFTTEKRDIACLLYSIYIKSMMEGHILRFNIDNTKKCYVDKLESGLNKEIKRKEDSRLYKKAHLKYFKDNPIISKIFKEVSEELDKEIHNIKSLIVDITKKSPLFDSKELLKLCVDNKHYVTISAKDIYSSVININYRLDGLFSKNIEVPFNPTSTLKERIIEEVKDFEREYNINVIPKIFNSSSSDRFDKNIEILTVLKIFMKDTTVSSIELNPMVPLNTFIYTPLEYTTAPFDLDTFYLDIKVTRRIQDVEATSGYLLMREPKLGESLLHHSLMSVFSTYKLYKYEPKNNSIKINSEGIKLRPLLGNRAELVIPTRSDSIIESFSFSKICLELCKLLGKDMSKLMNCEYNIGHLIGFVYDNKISKLYDSDTLEQLNKKQEEEVYNPFINEIINIFNNSHEDQIKNFEKYGRFSKINQIKASVAYNFRNLLAELNNKYLASNIIVSDASCYLISDCELLKNPTEYSTMEAVLLNNTEKHLTQVLSLRDTLTIMLHCNTKDGKIIIRTMDVLLTKNGPIISRMLADGKVCRDTKKFASIQENLKELLGGYLYGLLKFLGKLLYIYDLLNDNERGIQYLDISRDGENIETIVDLVYSPVKDRYEDCIKRLRFNIDSCQED